MADYGSNIIYNPSAAGFGTASWTIANAVVSLSAGSDLNGKYFIVGKNGYMKQTIQSIRFGSVTPIDFNFELDYWLDKPITVAKVIVYAELEFVYSDGTIDVFTMPCTGQYNKWNGINQICETLDLTKDDGTRINLTQINLSLYCGDFTPGIRVDNFKLQANSTSRDKSDSDDMYDNFPDKAILYGLDSAKPVLR